jgi:predicted MPP superfamily phosphohydrolase
MANFHLLHASDFHFCVEANRENRVQMWKDRKSDWYKISDSKGNHIKSPRFDLAADLGVGSYTWSDWTQQVLFKDFHFSSYRWDVAEQFARFVEVNKDQIDIMVLTGDFAATGLESDLKAAKKLVTSDPNYASNFRNSKISAPLSHGIPSLLLPGNHDRYSSATGRPGGRNFEEEFREFWPRIPSITNKVTWQTVGVEECLIVIGADFTLKSEADIKSDGSVSQEFIKLRRLLGRGVCHHDILQDLVKTTEALKIDFPSAAIVWSVHFPVGQIENDDLAFVNWELLRDAALNQDIKIILAGHIHKQARISHEKCDLLIAGSCCAVDFINEQSFSILEIDTLGKELRNVKLSWYGFKSDRFFHSGEETIIEGFNRIY